MNASGPVAPSSRTRHTCPKQLPIHAVRGAAVGLSVVMTRSKDLRRGQSQPGIHVVELRPCGCARRIAWEYLTGKTWSCE